MRLSKLTVLTGAVVSMGAVASAQFTDLQPGRNFPSSVSTFGGNHSENIDVGDVDNDGDLDVIVANGGDQGDQPNRIFINNGGAQGGTEGTFTQETNTRFAGIPNDTSRDCEFADIDNDGDLDIYISNRGGNTVGQTSRFYINDGNGFFTEETNTRWGSLISVPAGDQILGGNSGPFRDWSCDCDFADIDDDGDLDLFHSSYGPSLNGTRDSRIFINDGNGVFNEQWPWIDAGADIKTHTLDLDIVDLDGDLDFDIVMSSRDSQARIYMNNLYNPLAGSSQLYTDTTQVSLLNQGAALSGTSNYEGEFGDLDDDGDFDVWMKNYQNFTDKILFNLGTNGAGIVLFQETAAPIKGDPNQDENEIDLFDFDGDGDLDAFAANFSGTNRIYAGGNAQGGSIFGQYHRTGTTASGSQYSFPEVPTSGNNSITLDGEVADVDGDGDYDLLTSNDNGAANRLWTNALGIPDTHAPTFFLVDDTKTSGADMVIHAQLRDNAPYYLIAYYDVTLTYSVNGSPSTTIDMFSQGSQQFRGVVPGGVGNCVTYTIDATDDAGNSAAFAGSTGCGGSPWMDLGDALAGVSGDPALAGTGPLTSGSAGSLDLTNAAPSAIASLFVGLTDSPVPFKGGTLHPVPILTSITLTTSGSGTISLPFIWPAGIPGGFQFFTQFGISDTAAVKNVSLSNALSGTAQ